MNYEKHEFFMHRALIESRKAIPFSSPNPNVGAIVVKNNRVVGKGFTQIPGNAHAEVIAIQKAGSNAKGASLYVTLEPCSYYGKTPPCTDLIIQKKIRNVFVGLKDPNPAVFGKGIDKLRRNKINVKIGILKEEIEDELQWYIKYTLKKIPYITLKSGISLDGKIADSRNDSRWITSRKAREFSQKLREANDGIIAGINTITKDNPILTCRGGNKNKQLFRRIILDTNLRISLCANILKPVRKHAIIIAVDRKNKEKKKIKLLQDMGADILFCKTRESRIDINDLLKQLGAKNITKLIIEGGGEVNFSFLKENIVDKIVLFISPRLIGGIKSKGWIGGRGFLLKQNKKIEKGKFYSILSDSFMFEGYMNYYVYRNY